MKKNQLITTAVLGIIIGAAPLYAQMHEEHDHRGSTMENKHIISDDQKETVSVEIGNKICPVSGEKVGGAMGDPVKFEHNGKIYNLCCTMCAKDFEKDPEKYIKIVEEEMKLYKEGRAGHDEESEEGHEYEAGGHDHDHGHE